MRDSIKQEVPNIEQNPKYEDFYGLPQAATSAGIEANNISKKERKNGERRFKGGAMYGYEEDSVILRGNNGVGMVVYCISIKRKEMYLWVRRG